MCADRVTWEVSHESVRRMIPLLHFLISLSSGWDGEEVHDGNVVSLVKKHAGFFQMLPSI